MRATLRILVIIPLAFIAACLAAGGFVLAGHYAVDGGPTFADGTLGEAIMMAIAAAAVTGAFSFVPALLVIVLAEAFSWRSLLFYLLAGCTVGFAALAMLPPEEALSDKGVAMVLSAGAVAGAVYWLIAGRMAGPGRAAR